NSIYLFFPKINALIMSNKQKYKPGVKITMNRFHKFWVGTTTVLLTAVMLTSCGGGTSSNTGGGQAQNNNNNPQPGPQTLTVTVPSLGYVATITKSTTVSEIVSTSGELGRQCASLETNPFGSKSQTCGAEVGTARKQSLAFISP
ncbi:MAG: hypothetical protein ACKO98_08165, partial [Dolichospermum sp.]